jgi:hypothetical protein
MSIIKVPTSETDSLLWNTDISQPSTAYSDYKKSFDAYGMGN